jgi:hypothetical protein
MSDNVTDQVDNGAVHTVAKIIKAVAVPGVGFEETD